MEDMYSLINIVIGQMEESYLKNQLVVHFPKHREKLAMIENSFSELTSGAQDSETLRCFFHSWGQTNNSAMTVSGLSNRLSMHIHNNDPIADQQYLFRSLASLNRITDEDLAVTGRVLHSEMFYVMATEICGDDTWLLRDYLSKEAKAFKAWKDKNSLHTQDPMIGLLTTLVHEIYTHGEVEYILPKFAGWLEGLGFEPLRAKRALAWIKVHCGPTERDHFFHAVNAVQHYVKAMNINMADYDLGDIISNYVKRKADVMNVVGQQNTTLAA